VAKILGRPFRAWRTRAAVAGALALPTVLQALPATAQTVIRTYWIDESTDFTNNGCPTGNASDLNDVTGYLHQRLNAAAWSGERWMNIDAWTTDFQDEALVAGGSEGWSVDTKTLAVHAGHGWMGTLWFGFPRLNNCMVDMNSQTRLGTMTGNQAAYGMYLDSCVMKLDSLWRVGPNQVYQQFGYHNSPSIDGDGAGQFFDDTATIRNATAWVDRMDDQLGGFFTWNSPIALTYAPTQAQCSAFQDNAKLKAGVLVGPAPEPWSWYCYVIRNNGSGGCDA
jgi:hypothetical protein